MLNHDVCRVHMLGCKYSNVEGQRPSFSIMNIFSSFQDVAPGCEAYLKILKSADDSGFSFHWTRDKAGEVESDQSNILKFKEVLAKDFCHYQCQVKKGDQLIFTTYRAFFRSK